MATSQPPPTASAARAIAPDLARGLMLLLIAVANVPWSLYGSEIAATSAHRLDGDVLDRIWQVIAIVAIDGRSYPLFAFLFGYGIWQLYARQQAAGIDARSARRLLQRRHAWMLAFGLVHAALLWFGDIVGSYGLVGLLVTWLFLDRKDRTIRIWAIVLASVLGVLAVMQVIGGVAVAIIGGEADGLSVSAQLAATESYPMSIVERAGFWLVLTPMQGVIGLAVPIAVLVAIVAARHRVLEEPAQHRRLLARTAIAGIAIAWLGGVPSAFVHVTDASLPEWSVQGLQSFTGIAGGLGYAAAFALLAAWMARRGSGPVARALMAVGKRSLSSYLAQSVLIVPVLAAWGLGLGGVLTEWQAALYAVGVWLVTVVLAVVLERAGRRGPAEWLLRRLAYRSGTAAPTSVAGLGTGGAT